MMMMKIRSILLISIIVMATTPFKVDSVIQPLERYTFTSCNINRAFDSLSNETLLGMLQTPHPDVFACNRQQGLHLWPDNNNNNNNNNTKSILETTSSLEKLQRYLQDTHSTGLSISLWLQPATTNFDTIQPILTVGATTRNKLEDDSSGCPGFDLQISQYRNHFLLHYTDNDPAQSCRILLLRQLSLTHQMTHFVVVWSNIETSIYVDNEAVLWGLPNHFNTTLLHWNVSDTMQLFGNYQSKDVFQGSIYQVSLFDQALNTFQVSSLYEEGIVYVEASPLVLVAQAWNNVTLAQDASRPTTIWLGGSNTSTPNLQLAMKILSSPQHGQLTVNMNATVDNDRLLIPFGSNGLRVQYTLTTTDYFTVPRINANGAHLDFLESESFDFQLVAVDTFGTVLHTSAPVTQYVHVRHVNHRPVLKTPEAAVQSLEDPDLLLIQGIKVRDTQDFDLDRIRITVSAKAGRLTLATAYRHLADFDSSCRERTYSGWQCVGDGYADRNMTFLAIPSDVERILDNLEYQGFVKGATDEIVVQVWDGAGGHCLSEQEHGQYTDDFGNSFASIRRECFHAVGTIHVPEFKTGDKNGDDEGSGIFGIPNTDIKNFGLADFLFWLLVIVIIVGCCCCAGNAWHCLARGKRVEADNYDSSDELSHSEDCTCDGNERSSDNLSVANTV